MDRWSFEADKVRHDFNLLSEETDFNTPELIYWVSLWNGISEAETKKIVYGKRFVDDVILLND